MLVRCRSEEDDVALPPNSFSDAELVERYTTQPAALPEIWRTRVERAWGGEPIQAYAYADLDEQLMLAPTWIVVGPQAVAIVKPPASDAGGNGDGRAAGSGAAAHELTLIDRKKVRKVRERHGLSCNILYVVGDENDAPLAVLYYTHRQRRAMENIKFLLEAHDRSDEIDTRSPTDAYIRATLTTIREAQATSAVKKFTVVWRLLTYLKPYRMRLAIGMVAAVLMTSLALVPPYLTGYVIDHVIKPFQAGGLTHEKGMQIAVLILVGLGVSFALREFGRWMRLQAMSVLGEYVARDLRRVLYNHLQRLGLRFYSSKSTGSIITRVSSDTDRIWDFVAFGLVEVSLAIVMLTGLSVILLVLDWRLGIVMVLPVPLLLYGFFSHGRHMRRLFLRAWRKWSRVTEVLSDTIPGMRVVKAFNQEDYEVRRFGDRNDAATGEFNYIHTVWTRFWPVIMLAMHAMTLLVWMLALPRLVPAAGPEAASLTAGVFVSFTLYLGMFFAPLETIGMITRMMNRATSSAIRIFEILDTEPDIVEVEQAKRLEPVQGRVEFQRVTFAYDSIRPVIHDMSFVVEPGELIGLVGPSGSGKTTVTNLIVRFYEASVGRILIDGVNLRELDLGHFRRQVGMVLQDTHLFHGTILANIRYGRPDASLEEIIESARAANVHDFVCRLPHGYDTVVGERGHTLSGGEQQRVAIARAILSDPRILILDEATSSVDTETERKIQQALERLVQGRTVFAIAHRLSTLRRASRLFVIEKGRITEMGTHAELLEKEGGVYRKLHGLQQELHEMYAV